MVFLSPLKNKGEIEGFFKENETPFNEFSGCVTAYEKDNLLGYCLYYLDNEKMTIEKIVPEKDLMLADGILRSTLHVAAERSIMKAFCSEKCKALCSRLEFIINEEEKSLDINKLFKSCHGCSK